MSRKHEQLSILEALMFLNANIDYARETIFVDLEHDFETYLKTGEIVKTEYKSARFYLKRKRVFPQYFFTKKDLGLQVDFFLFNYYAYPFKTVNNSFHLFYLVPNEYVQELLATKHFYQKRYFQECSATLNEIIKLFKRINPKMLGE